MSHALLSASASKQWINCPPSIRLCESLKLQDSSSVYADEGSLAHSICEAKAKNVFKMGKENLDVFKFDRLYLPEMEEYTDEYIGLIKYIAYNSESPAVDFEVKLDFSYIVPDGYGTADCIIVSQGVLYVIDFKYGKGIPVSAFENSQMMLYALGAMREYKWLHDFTKIKMIIHQPRLNNTSEYEIGQIELAQWGEKIRPIAQQAYKGTGEFKEGEHCRWCKAKGLCRARAEFNMALLPEMRMDLDNDEIGDILERAQGFATWLKDVEEHALKVAIEGGNILGWKLVEGRAIRKFTNQQEAFNTLQIIGGIDEALLYERSPISLTAVEKLLGKKSFNEYLGSFITIPQGKPTLVLESDKRPVMQLDKNNLSEFKEEIKNG